MTDLETARNEQNKVLSVISGNRPKSPKVQNHVPFRDVHIVADGENLNNISMKYYGTSNRWKDIYEANTDVIKDVNRIKVGTALVIP